MRDVFGVWTLGVDDLPVQEEEKEWERKGKEEGAVGMSAFANRLSAQEM